MIDADIQLQVADRTRRFDLHVRFQSNANVLALYGPSGAGKTLTLLALAGLLRPQAGYIRLRDQTVFDATRKLHLPAHARRIGYVFQQYALFPHLTVLQNVAFGLTSWRKPRPTPAEQTQIAQVLDALELTTMASSYPQALSGGQQQRVALARALACEPQLLLLDEPFAALNPMLRAKMRAELKRVQQRFRVPMVMITHDLDDAIALADELLVLEQGRVSAQFALSDQVQLEALRRGELAAM